MSQTEFHSAWLDEDKWKRGPGGNWFKYRAWCYDAPSLWGYGCTAREAVNDLKSQMARED